MKIFCTSLFLGAWIATAAEPGTYQNPVMAGDYPDPSVIRVGKDYWATATSSEWGPQFPLLHSTDLVNWTQVGSIFTNRPAWAVGNFWAPEIAEYKGRYFIYYVGRKKGGPLAVAVASADKPQGPYTDHGVMVAQDPGSIDAVPFTDENGKRFLIWKEDGNSKKIPTILWAQELSEDGTKLLGEPKEILRNDAPWEGAVVEGPFLVRRGEWFYLFYSGSGCCGTGCNYALGVARSKKLLGPWEKDPANPILAGNNEWKCPGHGSIVTDPEGRYWLLYHAYSSKTFVFTGREGVLDEVKFEPNGWPTINQGKGVSITAKAPHSGVVQKKGELSFSDDFGKPALVPGWQWPQDNQPVVKFERSGLLTLQAASQKGNDFLGAVLARSTTAGNYEATARLDLRGLSPGVAAGLSAFGDAANAVGLVVTNQKLVLWRREKGKQLSITESVAPSSDQLYLRLTADQGHRFRFSSSADGKSWKTLGEDQEGKTLPPWDRSIRVALTVGGQTNAAARFDQIDIVPKP